MRVLFRNSHHTLFILVAFGSWFDYTVAWDTTINENPDYPIHTVIYEQLKRVSLYFYLFKIYT